MVNFLFVGNFNEYNELIPELKNKVISYFGTRMVISNCPESPGLYLKEMPSSEDVEYLTNLIKESGSQCLSIILLDSTESFGYVNILEFKK